MAHPTVLQHQERLEELYHGRPLPYFTPDDLDTIVASYHLVFDAALERKAVYPYLPTATGLFNNLKVMRDQVAEIRRLPMPSRSVLCCNVQCEAHVFPIYIPPGELREALQVLAPLISRTHDSSDSLSALEQAAQQDISFTIRPNNIVGPQYLAEARFLIPTSLDGKAGVHVFVITPQSGSSSTVYFQAEQRTKAPYATMDLALRKETDPDRLETVVVVQGTEEYSLSETVVPLLFNRYIEKLGSSG